MDRDDTRADSARVRAHNEPSTESAIGRVIDGRYRILERLGEGGMGAVFVAEHLQLQKRVALKTIHGQFADNREMAARFAREAMTSAHIEHPNVVSALDFGELPEGGAYLVMQLVRGPSLREHLDAHGKLAWPEACRLLAQVADALVTAHASGIVHRDLKPENVLLVQGDDGLPMVKVLDFGIAHVTAQSMAPAPAGKPLTQVGVVIGTPGYMPPEQAMGQGVDERADLYALGVMLWELVMGKGPFAGGSFTEIVTKQLSAAAPELAPPGRPAPAELRTLVSSLLDGAPAKRPAAAFLVRDTLRTLAQQAVAGDAVSLRWRPGEVARTSIAYSTRFVRAMPQPLRFAVLGAAAAVGLVTWWALREPSAADSTPAAEALPAEQVEALAGMKVEPPTAEPPKAEPEPEAELEPEEVAEPEQPEEVEGEAEAGGEGEKDARATKRTRRTRQKAESETTTQSAPKSKRPAARLKRAINELFN
jgi:tRNA A-37 threonylcarbamoyl transferase component Bud32